MAIISNPLVDRFLFSVTDWAAARLDITGLVLVGSYARNEARPDSDIDLVLLTANPQALLEDVSWVSQFGEVESRETEYWGRVTSIRVHYRNGLEVEFGISTPDWASVPVDEGTRRVVTDGMMVLLDRERKLADLLATLSDS